MKIVLAEDQAMVRGALASLITLSSPHQIVEAADGDVAYQRLKSDHFDLLLTDIEMPARSGLELAAWLQQDATLSPDLQRQQSIRLYLMSAAFFVLFYTFPAGMVLYWTSSNLFHLIKVEGAPLLASWRRT